MGIFEMEIKMIGFRNCGLLCHSFIFGLLSAASITYSATPDTFGISTRSISLGNSQTSGGDPAWAAWSNPAALSDTDRPAVGLNLLYTSMSLKDLSDGAVAGNSGLPADNYDASKANSLRASSFGLNLPLLRNVNLGFVGFLPGGSLAKIHGISGNESSYLRYSDRQSRPEVYTAIATSFDSFSLGIGAFYTVRAKAQIQAAFSSVASEDRILIDLKPVMQPYAGIQWKGNFGSEKLLTLGFTWREESKTKTDMDMNIVFDQESFNFTFNTLGQMVAWYDPERLRIGSAVETPEWGLFISGEFARWSDYQAPILRLSGKDIVTLTPGINTRQIELQDSYSLRAGYEYRVKMGQVPADLRVGIETHTSAVDPGQNDIAIVDMPRHVLSLGAGFNTEGNKVHPMSQPTSFDFAVQYNRLQLTKFQSDVSQVAVKAGGSALTVIGGFSYDM